MVCTAVAVMEGELFKDEFRKYLAQPGVKEALKNGEPRTKKRLETQGTA